MPTLIDPTRLFRITFDGPPPPADPDGNPIGQAILEIQAESRRTIERRFTPSQLQLFVARVRSIDGKEPTVEEIE